VTAKRNQGTEGKEQAHTKIEVSDWSAVGDGREATSVVNFLVSNGYPTGKRRIFYYSKHLLMPHIIPPPSLSNQYW
jgi:hypothetical protein